MRTSFGLRWMMALVFLYTTPIMAVTFSLVFILTKESEFSEGVRAGALGGLLWGLFFTPAMGLLAYSRHKELERKFKCAADYSPVQKRTAQLPGSVSEALALSMQALRDFRWIQGDSIEVLENKISAKTSIVMGRDSAISITLSSLTPGWATIEVESRPRHWLPVDCTLTSVRNVEEILEEIVKLSRSNVPNRENGDNSN